MKKRKWFRIFLWLVLIFVIYLGYVIIIFPPKVADKSAMNLQRSQVGKDFYVIGNNWLKKSETGLWEMYVDGNAFELGVKKGKLAIELGEFQEQAFITQIQKLVPSKLWLHVLRLFVAWFNRNLEDHVTSEYQKEIYGESIYASDKFNFIGPKYERKLYYHAAHDIGHALQDKRLVVGCTSFAAWNKKSADGNLIIARNFDFYVGDDFAKNKIVEFIHPDSGYKFMMVTWAGMIGAVSGMNEYGLTVTINASKESIPASAATPISLVAREILQYAKNISEAYAIAENRKTFVAESILIGSAEENKAAIIEKAPKNMDLFSSGNDFLICPNHYQGEAFTNDEHNIKNIAESSSNYRLQRMGQLLAAHPVINYTAAAEILRNQGGLNDKNIGMTNEKNINQLVAHHSIIFKPRERLVWVSTFPFQSGQFVCYDLKKVFAEAAGLKTKKEIYEKDLTIPADSFLNTPGYANFVHFKSLKKFIAERSKADSTLIPDETLTSFIKTNPECYISYQTTGDYYKSHSDYTKAIHYYSIGLNKEIATKQEKDKMFNNLSDCIGAWQKLNKR
ncbi:MAG TPA: C45 family peptidase [Bacteroidia bacterium]|nr:C45 family peptidase [Bacteroidia bacterium]